MPFAALHADHRSLPSLSTATSSRAASHTLAFSQVSRRRVLLASTLRWPLASRLAIGLAEKGCHVEAWYPTGHPLDVTRAVARRHRCRPFSTLASLQQAIRQADPDVVIPCDDDAVMYLHQLYQLARQVDADGPLAGLISRSLGVPEACAGACARNDLLQTASDLGLRIPHSADLPDLAAVDRWSEEIGYPAVFKASPSWGGRGVIRVDDPAAARAAFLQLTSSSWGRSLREQLLRGDSSPLRRQLDGERPRVVAQRFIVGRPANRAVACWRGESLAGISVRALETVGDTGPATVVEVIDPEDMREAGRRLVQHLGLSGFCGLDFIIEAGSGHAYLIEMNPRATPICHLALGRGHDLLGALVSQLRGDPPLPAAQPWAAENGAAIIALFPGEWRRDPHSAYLHSAHHDVPWREPALVEDCTGVPWEQRNPLARLRRSLRGTDPAPRPFLIPAQRGSG